MNARRMITSAVVAWMASALVSTAGTVDFENLSLSPDSYWNGESNWDGIYPATPLQSPKTYNDTFSSGGAAFNNQFQAWTGGAEPPYWNYTSWSGWAYSNKINSSGSGFTYQYDAKPGAAKDGSIFAVAYAGWGGVTPTMTLDTPTVLGVGYFTNTTYVYDAIQNGDWFSSPIGAGGWFKTTLTGKDEDGNVTATLDVFLADYTSANSADWYITDTWKAADLSVLGTVKSVEFAVSGSNAGWPTYVAMDSVIPEPATISGIAIGGLIAIAARRRRR